MYISAHGACLLLFVWCSPVDLPRVHSPSLGVSRKTGKQQRSVSLHFPLHDPRAPSQGTLRSNATCVPAIARSSVSHYHLHSAQLCAPKSEGGASWSSGRIPVLRHDALLPALWKPSARAFVHMKRYHHHHHFSHQTSGYGISSPLWDFVFNTRIHLRKLRYQLRWS